MLSTLINTAFVVVLATCHVALAQLQILTPVLVQCQDAVISYSGGQGNYGVYVVPSGNPCADSVVDIPEQEGTSFNWKVIIPAGSLVEFLVEDATSAEAWSGVITVQNSSDASCIDPKATQALLASNSLPQSSSSAASSSMTSSSPSPDTPSTTAKISSASSSSYASGPAKTVIPVANPSSGLANAAGNGASNTTSQPNSGLPRAGLPACSLLGVVTFLFTMVHIS